MEVLEFVNKNNIDYNVFTNNYEAILCVYNICKLAGNYKIFDLNIDNNKVSFKMKKNSKYPTTDAASFFKSKLDIEMNIINNMVEYTIKVSG